MHPLWTPSRGATIWLLSLLVLLVHLAMPTLPASVLHASRPQARAWPLLRPLTAPHPGSHRPLPSSIAVADTRVSEPALHASRHAEAAMTTPSNKAMGPPAVLAVLVLAAGALWRSNRAVGTPMGDDGRLSWGMAAGSAESGPLDIAALFKNALGGLSGNTQPSLKLQAPGMRLPTAAEVVQGMYANINARDIEGAMAYVDDNCVYQDLNFNEPFVGAAGVRRLFTESVASIPPDMLFCVDEITSQDPLAVGVTWHVELGGVPFPNGRGCSYYRIDPTSRKLVYARDCVEPAIKPGPAAFFIIRLVAPIARRFLKAPAQPSGGTEGTVQPAESAATSTSLVRQNSGTELNIASVAIWVAAAAYIYFLLLSPPGVLPGEPAWAIKPETVTEVIGESTNFFFVLPILNRLGVTFMEAPVVHPVTESLFNVAEAYIFMLLPLLLVDRRTRPSLNTVPVWSGAMFLTNAFLLPYMAIRKGLPALPLPSDSPGDKGPLAKPFGVVGLLVGLTAIGWFIGARPEVGGDLGARVEYFQQILTTQRVALAFAVDIALFAVAQYVLIGAVEPEGSPRRGLRWVPFWGLAAWLIL